MRARHLHCRLPVELPIIRLELELPIKEAPKALYIQGTSEGILLLSKLPQRGLAVVGTRRPQPRAESLVRRAILDLRGMDLVILSGLALGIDSCAHKAALEAGLPTIAVLGCGLNLQYPPENNELRKKILDQGGLLISEYSPDEPAKPSSFIQRNRIIAGLSKATWIAQAPFRSGALNTAKWARENGKDCYATPCFPGDPPFAGTQDLLDRGLADPLWDAESLDGTWKELTTWFHRRTQPRDARSEGQPVLDEIRCRTAQAGGVTCMDLFDWAVGKNISPPEFFEQLQKAQQCGLVSERNGVLATT